METRSLRRRRRGGTGGDGNPIEAHATAARNGTISKATPDQPPKQSLEVQESSSGSSSIGRASHKEDVSSGSTVRGQRRQRLWRAIHWPLTFGVALLALVLLHQQLIEEAPLTELFQEGLVGPLARLNVSLPPLPRRSLEALIASAGVNVSMLLELTDSLTDTLVASRLSLAGLLPQLPAFNLLPPLGLSGAAENRSVDGTGLRPGMVMARRGYRAKHPVVIVPGFVTSGLELWQGLPCGQRYFRQRMWGTLAMVQAFLTDPACWFRHMELDPATGLDPAGIKIRAAVGLEAVDYFIQGYWVWGKLVEALADVGYDSNNLVSMPYDWRLAMPLLEERDGYFIRFRLAVEALAEVNDERVVLTGHSYGENVVRSFMTWVEAEQPGWVEAHVEAVVNIAGTSLGVPKSISALLSGETRDTAQLGALAGFLTSNLVPRATRTRVWRTWGASYAMLPVGGPQVWGNASWAPDDTPEMRAENRTYGAMVSLWPHDWETVFAAAANAPPQQRAELHRLVHNVSETAEPPSSPEPVSELMTAAAAVAAAAASMSTNSDSGDGGGGGRGVRGGNGSGSGGGGGGGGSTPMSRITDTLKRLVSSGGSDIVLTDYLNSEHVTRLDVTGFLALLREVGGPVLDQHMREWAAVDLSPGGAAGDADEAGRLAQRRAASAADADTPQAKQALGGARRLRKSVRRRIALFPDATRTPLPNAPTTSIVCMYGVGLPTERGYHYLRPPPAPPAAHVPLTAATAAAAAAVTGHDVNQTDMLSDQSSQAKASMPAAAAATAASVNGSPSRRASSASRGSSSGKRSHDDDPSHQVPPPPHSAGAFGEESSPDAASEASGGWTILRDVSNPGTSLDVGVQLTDGDGTVPLLSLGLMCRGGWRPGSRLNPGGMRVVTREFKHRSVSLLQDARGGPATASHIEILGNEAVMQDVIRVAAGRVDELDDVIHSAIDRIAAAVEL